MSSSNPPEPVVEVQTQPDVTADSPKGTQSPATGEEPRSRRPCRFYRSSRGCFKGDQCPNSHSFPARKEGGTEETSSSPPAEPSSPQPKKKKKPFKPGKGRGKLSPEQVKEQAEAQSAKAKAENAKKITIFSEDDENSWSLERDFLSAHSKTLAHVLSFSPRNADIGAKDPIKYVRGLLRFGDQSESLQLDDVKSDDFDAFLTAIRAKEDAKYEFDELRAILTLSTDWGFDELRNRAIRDIEKLHPGPVDRTVLARRCKITKWIRGALLSLTLLPDPLNATEILLIGTTTAALIWRAREEIFIHRLQALSTQDRSSNQLKCTGTGCKKVIREALLRVLEQPGTAGKSEADLASLTETQLKGDEKIKDTLCESCQSEESMKTEINSLVGDLKLARIIMEVQLGKDGAKWLEPVA